MKELERFNNVNRFKSFAGNAEKTIRYKIIQGHFMKNKKLPSFIALSISLELMLSPLPAIAEQNTGQRIMNAVQMGGQLYDQFRGGAGPAVPPPHVVADMGEFKKQQTPVPDKHFSWNNLSKIPGLKDYIQVANARAAANGGKMIDPNQFNCPTLPTTLHEAKNAACKQAGSQAEADEAYAYFNQYDQISKLYRNYSVESNSDAQFFGAGCMKRALDILNGFFKYRLEQLDLISAKLDEEVEKFDKDPRSKAALQAVKDSSAFLNGPDSQFGRDKKDPEFFNYAKALGSPACNSVFAPDTLNDKIGATQGLKGIDRAIKEEYNKPVGNFTLQNYSEKHADVLKDIQDVAKNVGKHAKNNFSSIANSEQGYGEFLSRLGTEVSSDQGVTAALSPSFFTGLRGKFAEKRKTLTNEMNLIRSELGDNPAFNTLAEDDDSNFDAELNSLQNRIKGSCVADNAGVENAIGRINDATVSSKTANKASTNQIKQKIRAIIKDLKKSPEQKLAELKEIETKAGGRYELKMEGDYETEVLENGQMVKKTVNAASRVTPSAYFTDIIKNCESQFEVNKLNNKLSAKEAVKRLRTLKKDFQKAARQHQDDIQKEITRKLIDCGGDAAVANSTGTGSCSSDKLNMSSPKFCAKAAFSCSKNMQQCTELAKNLVTKTTQVRKAATQEYNNNVDKVAAAMTGIFDGALNKYTKEAELLRGMFGAGDFSLPQRVQPPEGGAEFKREFAAGNDPDQIKEPKAYLQTMRENMKNLKETVKKQQEQIVGGSVDSNSGILAKHMQDTVKKYNDEVISKAEKYARECEKSYAAYNQGVAKSNEELARSQSELGEKRTDFCSKFMDVMAGDPRVSCKDGVGDTASSVIKAAEKIGDSYQASEARRLQNDLRTYCGQYMSQRDKDGKSTVNAATVCARHERGEEAATEVLKSFIRGDAKTAKDVCDAIQGNSKFATAIGCKEGTKTFNDKGNESTTPPDCTAKADAIAKQYEESISGAITASLGEQDDRSGPRPDATSFCNASNNAGPFNFKGGFPNSQNPLGQPNGARTGLQ